MTGSSLGKVIKERRFPLKAATIITTKNSQKMGIT
jgi:hypothetical protein